MISGQTTLADYADHYLAQSQDWYLQQWTILVQSPDQKGKLQTGSRSVRAKLHIDPRLIVENRYLAVLDPAFNELPFLSRAPSPVPISSNGLSILSDSEEALSRRRKATNKKPNHLLPRRPSKHAPSKAPRKPTFSKSIVSISSRDRQTRKPDKVFGVSKSVPQEIYISPIKPVAEFCGQQTSPSSVSCFSANSRVRRQLKTQVTLEKALERDQELALFDVADHQSLDHGPRAKVGKAILPHVPHSLENFDAQRGSLECPGHPNDHLNTIERTPHFNSMPRSSRSPPILDEDWLLSPSPPVSRGNDRLRPIEDPRDDDPEFTAFETGLEGFADYDLPDVKLDLSDAELDMPYPSLDLPDEEHTPPDSIHFGAVVSEADEAAIQQTTNFKYEPVIHLDAAPPTYHRCRSNAANSAQADQRADLTPHNHGGTDCQIRESISSSHLLRFHSVPCEDSFQANHSDAHEEEMIHWNPSADLQDMTGNTYHDYSYGYISEGLEPDVIERSTYLHKKGGDRQKQVPFECTGPFGEHSGYYGPENCEGADLHEAHWRSEGNESLSLSDLDDATPFQQGKASLQRHNSVTYVSPLKQQLDNFWRKHSMS